MNMTVEKLADEYEIGTGFIGRLRDERVFDEEKANRYLSNLSSIEVDDSISLDLAKLIWNLPIMLQWELERSEPNSLLYNQIEDVLNKTVNILEEIIGVP